jgi:Ni,Fe-hydrogenase III large subunit
MIQPERAEHVKFSEPDKVLNKKRLVIGGARLIQRYDVRSRAARRVQEIWATITFLQRVSGERRVVMVNDATERQSAAFKDCFVALEFAEANVGAAVIEILITERGA